MNNDNIQRKPELSIIIVNFNSGELLGNCIVSILRDIDVDFEVVVYDNASSDMSVTGLSHNPRINIIYSEENIGFARANNLAAKAASGRLLHFLNPDIEVNATLNDAYKQLITANGNDIWVTGLTNELGEVQKNKHIVPRIGNMFRHLTGNSDVALWNLGASIIIGYEAFWRIGGWPEDYFMYAEDLDFFYTAYRFRIPVHYLETNLKHIGKGTTKKIWSDEQRAMIVESSYRKFFRKYNANWEYLLIRPLQLFYILLTEPASFVLYGKVFLKTLFIK